MKSGTMQNTGEHHLFIFLFVVVGTSTCLFFLFVLKCTPGCHQSFWLPGHTAGSWATYDPPGHPGPLLQSFCPAVPNLYEHIKQEK